MRRVKPCRIAAVRCFASLLLGLVLIATAHAGDLLVSSRFSDNVLRFDGDTGAFKSVFASGQGLDNPNGIAFGPDGHLYVGLGDVGRVMIFDGATGAFLRDFVSPPTSGGLNGCRAIAFLPNGDLLVDDGPSDRVMRYAAGSGAFLGVFASGAGMRGPVGLHVLANGEVAVGAALSNTVYLHGPDGTLRRSFAAPAGQSNVTGVLETPEGRLLVAHSVSNTVRSIDPATGVGGILIGPGALNIPIGLILHPDGSLLVGSFADDRVQRYDRTTGALLGTFVMPSAGGLDGTHNFAWMPDADVPANPRVLFDTDQGPLLFELDAAAAPNTSAHFLAQVEAGRYDASLLDAMVQGVSIGGGETLASGAPIAAAAAIASERQNGLLHTRGSLSLSLVGSPPQPDSGRTAFFVNAVERPGLEQTHTVFGNLIAGSAVLDTLVGAAVDPQGERPLRPALLRRAAAVEAGAFPILAEHSGAWFDPANSGRGFQIDVAAVAGGSDDPPLLVVFWYDHLQGQTFWVNGIAPFEWGDSRVSVPLQSISGGQFGQAFRPDQLQFDPDWGTLTVEFLGCEQGRFEYTTRLGNGTVDVRNLTRPQGRACAM